MDFYQLHTLGDLKYNSELYYYITKAPEGMGMRSYCMSRGKRATPYYPTKTRARIYLDPDPRYKGTVFTSLLGNTNSYLIVCSALQAVIASFCQHIEVEYLPFDLYDSPYNPDKKTLVGKYDKKNILSKDYFIINPIGTWDCLDKEASGVEYGPEGGVIHVARCVIDNKKTTNLPHLFRPQEKPSTYIVSEYLAKALEESNFSNVQLELLNQV